MSWVVELLVSLVVALSGAAAGGPADACAAEDSNGCVWVAEDRGDGNGASFVATPDGLVVEVPARVAREAVAR